MTVFRVLVLAACTLIIFVATLAVITYRAGRVLAYRVGRLIMEPNRTPIVIELCPRHHELAVIDPINARFIIAECQRGDRHVTA